VFAFSWSPARRLRPVSVQPVAPTLRERRREETLRAILDAAHAQLVAEGPAALSLRAVAREVGLAVSALYRYVPSRHELLTELVVAGFAAQAEAVERALREAGDPLEALGAGLWAYRTWSVEHPAEFGLLYGAPVPGYQAPARTVAARARPGELLAHAVEDLCRQGRVDERGVEQRVRRLDRATRAEFARNARRRGYDLPDAVAALLFDGFVRLHGVTVMEVFGQLGPLTDRPEDYAACLVDGLIADLLGHATRQTVATTSSSTTRSRNASTEASR
jgi:AcrR family transcriptional regulator